MAVRRPIASASAPCMRTVAAAFAKAAAWSGVLPSANDTKNAAANTSPAPRSARVSWIEGTGGAPRPRPASCSRRDQLVTAGALFVADDDRVIRVRPGERLRDASTGRCRLTGRLNVIAALLGSCKQRDHAANP